MTYTDSSEKFLHSKPPPKSSTRTPYIFANLETSSSPTLTKKLTNNMPTFTVYKGSKDGYPKKGSTTKPDELTGDLVHVKVTASGLCGTGM